MAHIHWYPGHIAKAEKKLKELINLVDVVIEVLDARIPDSSVYPDIKKLLGEKPRLIVLNKSDLADETRLKEWTKYYEEKTGFPVIASCASKNNDISLIEKKVIELAKPRIDKLVAKGLLPRPARVVVVGMPNVGKSSIINKLIRKGKAKVGAKAGVTRQQQWVRVNPKIDLLDTPGIIPLKQEDQIKAGKLAMVNSVSENAYENEEVAQELLEILAVKYPEKVKEYYNLTDEISLSQVAKSRNWIVKNSEPDIIRASVMVLTDFRSGRIGRFTLDDFENKENQNAQAEHN
ncbi:MAG: ribosome biogenesis GTPase YlqF [Clostridium sp.]|nr:ribosome biogenesis GTPase YlqF [Clostridium sp.]